jgi:hypothetical protein
MRYIVGLLLGIGLIVLTIILIFKAFSGGSDAPKTPQIDLNSYANTQAVMRYTIDGQVNSNQKHERVRITVSSDRVLFEEIQGYQGQLKQSKTYPNNPDAYATFLHALTLVNYAKGNPEITKDERGYCPTGRRYIYEGLSGGDSIFRWWSDSCTTKDGNFLGVPSTVQVLFTNQVPDYNTLTSRIVL